MIIPKIIFLKRFYSEIPQLKGINFVLIYILFMIINVNPA